ncbi:hypothetical protein KAJ83_07345 [Marivibrio halodurans]|uniref:AphA-like transcriptional regulator n=1 Tax=Marivibrio halodurans TaxID=2039722 RepID=A0A8J7SLF4_9PROT|nr:hypothetical protein [Marivibrio halodurans]MBP5856818.1 hypothetical protein [Marivibrio halodurans]
MYRDRSLVPTEAVRLAALGGLMEGGRHYDALADEIRFFTARVVGPSLDLLGSSLELLLIEGLAEETGGAGSGSPSREIAITDAGCRTFHQLMAAAVRAPLNDISRLVLLLKLRFLPLQDAETQEEQLDMIADLVRTERARIAELATEYETRPMAEWLAFDIEQADRRLAWLEARMDALALG